MENDDARVCTPNELTGVLFSVCSERANEKTIGKWRKRKENY
jgi:hypothetical protein